MTVTPSDLTTSEQELAVDQDFAAEAAADLDFGIPEEVPSADDSSSRNAGRDLDAVGFTLDEFASLLSKYDYNFKPGDVVKGTVFAIEPKGSMIDIGAKTAAFMPMQEVSINRVESISDVLEPGEEREFFGVLHAPPRWIGLHVGGKGSTGQLVIDPVGQAAEHEAPRDDECDSVADGKDGQLLAARKQDDGDRDADDAAVAGHAALVDLEQSPERKVA